MSAQSDSREDDRSGLLPLLTQAYLATSSQVFPHVLTLQLQSFIESQSKIRIQECHTPEAIGELAPLGSELDSVVINVVANQVRQQTLGLFVVNLSKTISSHGTLVQALTEIGKADDAGVQDLESIIYDDRPVLLYAEEQKNPDGALFQDPSWEWDYSEPSHRQWIKRLEKSVQKLQNCYAAAFKRKRPEIVQMVQQDSEALSTYFKKDGLDHLCSMVPPPPEPTLGPSLEETDLAAARLELWTSQQLFDLGQTLRKTLVTELRKQANDNFESGGYQASLDLYRPLYSVSIHSGNDPSLLVNSAAALLKLDNPSQAESTCSDALALLANKNDSKSQTLRWKALIRRARAKKAQAETIKSIDPSGWRVKLESARTDFKQASEMEPKDTTTRIDLEEIEQALQSNQTGSTSNDDNVDVKPREKTILESPFFRTDLVQGLMRDTLISYKFPTRALHQMFSLPPLDLSETERSQWIDSTHQTVIQMLTLDNLEQIKEANQVIGAVLALPDFQKPFKTIVSSSSDAVKVSSEPSEWLLKSTSLRLVLGALAILSNQFVQAQSELELVSDTLKPDPHSKKHSSTTCGNHQDEMIENMLITVKGYTLWLLEKCCHLQQKKQEQEKFKRWLIQWYNNHQTDNVTSVVVDTMVWWDWILKD